MFLFIRPFKFKSFVNHVHLWIFVQLEMFSRLIPFSFFLFVINRNPTITMQTQQAWNYLNKIIYYILYYYILCINYSCKNSEDSLREFLNSIQLWKMSEMSHEFVNELMCEPFEICSNWEIASIWSELYRDPGAYVAYPYVMKDVNLWHHMRRKTVELKTAFTTHTGYSH